MGGVIAKTGLVLTRMSDLAGWGIRRAARRFTQRFGYLSWILVLCAVVIAGALIVQQQQEKVSAATMARMAQQKKGPAAISGVGGSDDRTRLQAFTNYLLPSETIPDVVQDLLKLADIEKLSITRSVYQPQTDVQGGFMRYRITMPVKGDAKAIYRFMQAALRAQKSLALEGVQFKRERIESTEIEARIQWVVLARLPPVRSGTAEPASTASEKAR